MHLHPERRPYSSCTKLRPSGTCGPRRRRSRSPSRTPSTSPEKSRPPPTRHRPSDTISSDCHAGNRRRFVTTLASDPPDPGLAGVAGPRGGARRLFGRNPPHRRRQRRPSDPPHLPVSAATAGPCPRDIGPPASPLGELGGYSTRGRGPTAKPPRRTACSSHGLFGVSLRRVRPHLPQQT